MCIYTPDGLCVTWGDLSTSSLSPHLPQHPPPPPSGDYSAHLLGDAGCCVVNKSLLYQRPHVVRSTALIFISDSGSHKSKSKGAWGAATRSFNFLLWEDWRIVGQQWETGNTINRHMEVQGVWEVGDILWKRACVRVWAGDIRGHTQSSISTLFSSRAS